MVNLEAYENYSKGLHSAAMKLAGVISFMRSNGSEIGLRASKKGYRCVKSEEISLKMIRKTSLQGPNTGRLT